jgi:hypothetical protein
MNRAGFLSLIWLLTVTFAGAAETSRADDADPLFAADDVLEITLEGPLRALSRDRAETPEVRPGVLRYLDGEGVERTLEVQLEPRGKSRRDREVCTFPPLWVHFDKDAVQDTLFDKQNKLKMVTYCRSPKNFQDYVIKEYLVYRIFNLLTDASFRVRLLSVGFQEEGAGSDPTVRYGFFIEHKKRLSKRLDMKVREPEERISPQALEPAQAAIAEVFQYFVSNTDFSFIAPPVDDTCCHNAVLFGEKGAEEAEGTTPVYLPVPYDFDRTGLVDPPNGLPAEELGQRSFRDRVYRGFCRDPEYLEAALEKTRAARADIERLIGEEEALSKRSRDRALKYVQSFYDIIDDPRRRDKALKCRSVS